MRLLAERVALEQAVGSRTSSGRVAGGQSPFGDDRQRVLESVGQSFALGGEAIVTETLEQVSVIELDGRLRLARRPRAGSSSKAVTSSSIRVSILMPTVSASMSSTLSAGKPASASPWRTSQRA